MPEASTKNPVLYRTYSRKNEDSSRESESALLHRSVGGLFDLSQNLTDQEQELILQQALAYKSLPSGRWLWIGGTEWVKKPNNFYGSYNCCSIALVSIKDFARNFSLLCQGSGVGTSVEHCYISQLPPITAQLEVEIIGQPGDKWEKGAPEDTKVTYYNEEPLRIRLAIQTGDSREGWVRTYEALLDAATFFKNREKIKVEIDLSYIRPSGTPIKGFGGSANPVYLAQLFTKSAEILNLAYGRQLTSVECCLLLGEAAKCAVAGNIRRSARINLADADDKEFMVCKDNLWTQSAEGTWRIDPERDSLRMSNHTRLFHTKPTLEQVTEAVTKQYYSGEGAVGYAPEAIARANADLLDTAQLKQGFISAYLVGEGKHYLSTLAPLIHPDELEHRLTRYLSNPCFEVIGKDFLCNLTEVHLNNLDPTNIQEQLDAFTAAGLSSAILLHHEFNDAKFQQSREWDPIVGVSFTGLFDFFVKLFGVDWLLWWQAGRPSIWSSPDWAQDKKMPQSEYFTRGEREHLELWKGAAQRAVKSYCDRNDLRVPNRCTLVQPAGTKSLLTGASCGWHPPKAARYIRRITFAKNDPVALACIKYGYSVLPGQSDTDEAGNLLTDPYSDRCTEWLVELPVELSWASIADGHNIDINSFSAKAQMDFYMQVQKYYSGHTTSATIELRESEIQELSQIIHGLIQGDEGYISVAMLARHDNLETMPRMPFEPISKEKYEVMQAQVLANRSNPDFFELLHQYDLKGNAVLAGPAGCDSDFCEVKDKRAADKVGSKDIFAKI